MLKRISRSIIVSLLSVSMVLTSVTPVFADDLISELDILSVQEEAVEGYDFDDDVVEEDISDVQSDSVTEITEEGDLIVDTSEESLINDDTEILTTEEVWDGITTEKVYEQDDIKYVFRITSSWSGGYNAKVEIYNNRSEIIDNWAIDMVFSGEITNIWNATIENRDDRTYTIKNAVWNADIKSGQSVSFGFTGKGEFGGFPESFNTLGLIVEKSDEEYDVQYYLDSDWGSGFTGRIVITNNSDETIEDWILSFTFDREITSIWNASIESHEGNQYVIKNASYNANIPRGSNISFGFKGKGGSIADETYGFLLRAQNLYQYDSMDLDTDVDGIPDGYETMILYTNPLLKDSDMNGINDGDEDIDNDGLNNFEEIRYNSHPLLSDGDGDGISDFDEIKTYGTDPSRCDSDDDGADDKWEIDNGYDPMTFNDSFLISGFTEGTYVKVSADVQTVGSNVGTLKIEKSNNILINEEIPGYIDNAFDFEVDGNIISAVIKFEIDRELFEKEDFDPTIYYYNDETQLFEEIETSLSDNIASAEVTHFSTYILLNRTEYKKVWSEIREPGAAQIKNMNIVFVVDTSSSMAGNRITTAKNVIKKFIWQISDEIIVTKMALVNFADSASIKANLTSDYKSLEQAVDGLSCYGGTAVYSGLNSAINILSSKTNKNTYSAIVLLTDGEDYPGKSLSFYNDYIKNAKDHKINVYTIGMATANEALLIKIADETDGKYYYAAATTEIFDIYQQINTEIVDYTTDSNNDGISDYYTRLLCDGTLTIGTKINMFKNISYDRFNQNDDYDEDGIVNGDELELKKDTRTGRVYAYMHSNPLSKDSDGDGIEDFADDDILESSRGMIIYKSYKSYDKLKNFEFALRPEDFQYADKSKRQLQTMKYININDFLGEDETSYKTSMKTLFKLFSQGDMESIGIKMIERFCSGTEKDFKDNTLNQIIKEDDATKIYYDETVSTIDEYLKVHDNLNGLKYNYDDREKSYIVRNFKDRVNEPVYGNIWNGLAICIHSLYGNEIEIRDFEKEENGYSYTLHFTMYDVFGLDSDDIEKRREVLRNLSGYGSAGGFRSWYILQHWDKYNGTYKPFVTYIEFDMPVRKLY